MQNARGWRSECSRSAPPELNPSVCLCLFLSCSLPHSLSLSLFLSLSLSLCWQDVSPALQISFSCVQRRWQMPESQRICSLSLFSLSFPTLCVPQSVFCPLWFYDSNPLRKYKAKSLWMIHLVTLLPYSATVVFFHSVLISFFSQPAISCVAISHSHLPFILKHTFTYI